MKYATSKPKKVPYVQWLGDNQEAIKDFFHNDRSLFEWEGAVLGRRQLILKQSVEVMIPIGHIIYLDSNGIYYHCPKDRFLIDYDI